MKINLRGTSIELTQAISDYVYKKISSIEKYLPVQAGLDKKSDLDIVAQVEVGKSTRHHKTGNIFRAEVHIIGVNLDLYAVSEMEDLYAAIDVVKDEIVHNIVQLKGKRETLARRGAETMKNIMKGFFESFKKKP